MIGGKPITVQMPTGNQRTLTLVGNQVTGTVGKLVCLPNSTVTTTSEQPKLMVVSRPRQPSATIASASFDSPATTDAALAALAAEAGLIDPETSTKFESEGQTFDGNSREKESTDVAETPMDVSEGDGVQENNSPEETMENLEMEVSSGGTESTAVTNVDGQTSVGLFGGGSSCRLGLKGGRRFKLGLLGGSPIGSLPKKPFMWRKGGLYGGGNGDSDTTTTSTNIFQNANNNSSNNADSVNFNNDNNVINNSANDATNPVDNSTIPLDIKNEYEEEDTFKLQFTQDDEENNDSKNSNEMQFNSSDIKDECDRIKQENDDNDINSTINGSNNEFINDGGAKKEEGVGDALSTLASAALGRATPQTHIKSETVSIKFHFIFNPFLPNIFFGT